MASVSSRVNAQKLEREQTNKRKGRGSGSKFSRHNSSGNACYAGKGLLLTFPLPAYVMFLLSINGNYEERGRLEYRLGEKTRRLLDRISFLIKDLKILVVTIKFLKQLLCKSAFHRKTVSSYQF